MSRRRLQCSNLVRNVLSTIQTSCIPTPIEDVAVTETNGSLGCVAVKADEVKLKCPIPAALLSDKEITFNQYSSEQRMSSDDCAVCLNGFTDPRSMPCGHTFCQGCIQRMAQGTRVDCPVDRRPFDIPPGGFTRNYALQDMLQQQQQQQQHPNVPQQPTRITPWAPRPPTRTRVDCPVARRPFDIPPRGFTRNYALQDMLQQQQQQQHPNVHRQPTRITPWAPRPPTRTRVDCPVDRRPFDMLQQQQQHPNVPRQPTRITPWAPRPPTRSTEQRATNYEIFYINVGQDQTADDYRPRTNTRTEAELPLHTKIRRNVRHVLKIMVDDRDHKFRTKFLVATMLLITFSRFIAGAVKLSSNCSMEQDVAVYLFVKSWIGFLFWSIIHGLVIKKKIGRALTNLFYEIFLVATTLFVFIWLIIGSVWVFGKHQEMREDCPLEAGINSWTADFINFAIFLTVLDWTFVTVFLFFFLYILCDDDADE